MGKQFKYSNEQLLEQFKAVLKDVGWDISANSYDRLGIPRPDRKTMRKRFNKTWTELLEMASPDATDRTFNAIIQQNKRLMKQNEKLRDLHGTFENICLTEIAKMQIRPIKIPRKEFSKDNLEFHALRSDAHVGEVVDPILVQGITSYSSEDYVKRVERHTERVITFREQDRASLSLNKLVVNHLGDQITGENIYKGQAFAIDQNAMQQFYMSVEVETNALLALAKEFPVVEVFCVIGNHGRPSRKGDNAPYTNFDRFFYWGLQKCLENQPNIKVYISEGPSMIVQHGEKVFLLNHGDSVVSYMGIPWYGLERQYNRLSALYNMIIDYEFTAHHHTSANIADRMFMNGTLVGGSELSINKMMKTSVPSQEIFYFHHKYGINRKTTLKLAEAPKLVADDKGIFTPYR